MAENRTSSIDVRWGAIFGLASFIVVVGSALAAGYYTLTWFSSLQREIATAIITGFVAVMISIVSVLISKAHDRKREIEQAHRPKKAAIYEDLMKFVLAHMLSVKFPDRVPKDIDGVDFFSNFTQQAIVWGSDDVLRQYSKWKFSMNDGDPNALVFEMEKLFFEIRKDMGHKNKGLRRGDILRIFTPDIEKHL